MPIEIEDLKRVSLLPGDVIMVKLKGTPNRDIMKRIADEFDGVFPNNKVVVIDQKFEVSIIGGVDAEHF